MMTLSNITQSIRPLLVVSALLLSIGCDSSGPEAVSASSATAPNPVAVGTARITEAKVTPEVTLVGTVTAIRRSIVGSPVEGRVSKISINAGDHVGMESGNSDEPPCGATLAQLDTEAITIEIAAARAELTRLQHELAELKAGSRPEELAQTKARLEAARDASEHAESRYRRTQELNRQNAIASQELDSARAEAFAAKQELIAASAFHDLTMAGPRKENIAQTTAKVDQQQQEISRLETQLRRHTIRAPFEGDVVRKLAEVGQWLNRGEPVAEIIELDPIDIIVHVPETLVTQIETGDKVLLAFDALPDGTRSFEGTIHGIVSSADQRSRTFPVRIRLANPTHGSTYLLRDGMLARATIFGHPRSTLLVPKDALILGGPSPVVMIAHAENGQEPVAMQVEVEPGVSREDEIEVRGDLKPGQQVIVNGNERVQPGQPLRLVSDEQSESNKSRRR